MTIEVEQVNTLLDRLLDAGRRRDPEGVAALCTDDVVFDDTGAAQALRGRDELREMFTGIYAQTTSSFDLDIIERYVAIDGGTFGARWRAKGDLREDPATEVEVETAEFYRIREGLIAHWTLFVRDPDWLGRQWGI